MSKQVAGYLSRMTEDKSIQTHRNAEYHTPWLHAGDADHRTVSIQAQLRMSIRVERLTTKLSPSAERRGTREFRL
jgi:hypothetical protein